MSRRAVIARVLLTSLAGVWGWNEALCQGLSVDVSVGRTAYEPVAANVGTNNLMGTLRYDSLRGAWVYGTAASPLRDGDPAWGSLGGGGRFLQPGASTKHASIGADLAAHAYAFRDTIAMQTGIGSMVDAIPFVRLAAGEGQIDLRGGWRGHALSFTDVTTKRDVFETGVRAGYGTELRVQGDMRWVHAREGTFPFLGASFLYGGTPIQAWLQAGKWLSTNLDEGMWGGGINVSVGPQMTLWASARQEAPDPLYWNVARRTWSAGVTRRFGGAAPVLLAAPRSDAGDVLIRILTKDAQGDAVSIAGDFNNWQAEPMQRDGDAWVIRLKLPAGVYHYAFRSARGEWFVPASVAGRRDDGMGGQTALLVVT